MTFVIKRGDTAPFFEERVREANGDVVDLSSVSEVDFHMRDVDYNIVVDDNTNGNVSIADASGGKLKYEWQTSDTSDIGRYKAEFVVTFNSGAVRTFPNNGHYIVEVTEDIND